MSSNKKKVSSNFKEWEKLTAQLEEKFAAMEIQQNLKEHYKTAESQLLTDKEKKEKNLIPSELVRLEKEIPALIEKIAKVENNIKGEKGFSLFKSDKTTVDQRALKKAKEKKHPAKKTAVGKKKKGIKEPPYASLPPISGLGLALQEKLQEFPTSLPDKKTAALPVDTRHLPSMEK